MRQTSYLGILLKVTVLILLLIWIDDITLHWAPGLWGQKEKEALGLPLFISYILFFYIVLYCPTIVLALYYIILYYPSIVPPLYYIVLALSQYYVILSCYYPGIVLTLYYIVLLLSYYYIILSYYYLILSCYCLILSYYCLILSCHCLGTAIYFLPFTKIVVMGICRLESGQ